MVHHRVFLWIGGVLLLLPFLGIPESWKHIIIFIIALSLIAVAMVLRSTPHSLEQSDASQAHVADDTVDGTPTPSIVSVSYEEEHIDLSHAHEPVPEFSALEETLDASESFSEHVEPEVVPVKKPRKKRVTKKEVLQSDIEQPLIVPADVLSEEVVPTQDEE